MAYPLIAFSAMLAIYGRYSRLRFILYVFKPLTMILIISLPFLRGIGFASTYARLVLAALVVSLIGDIFLMLPQDKFIQGLLAFLVAQFLYVLAFLQNIEQLHFLVSIPVLIFAVIIYLTIAPKLNKMRIPVLVYISLISMMGWLAVNRFANFQDGKSLCVLLGGVLFLVSDAILAINRFRRPFYSSQIFNLGAYFCAQLLFASSI